MKTPTNPAIIVDGIVYCPLYEEVSEVQTHFPPKEDFSELFGMLAYVTTVGSHRILVISPDEMGTSTARSVIEKVKELSFPKYIVCLGICGSLSNDAGLGDVCYSQEIIDVSENQKIKKDGVDFSPRIYDSTNAFDRKMGIITAYNLYKQHYEKWREDAHTKAAEITSGLGKNGAADSRNQLPVAVRGPIICGPVAASQAFKRKMNQINRKALCIETESSGLYQAMRHDEQIEVICVRGVSDLADERKNQTEEEFQGAYRRIGILNAASFLKLQIEHNPFFSEEILKLRQRQEAVRSVPHDPAAALLETVTVSTESALAELSPDYKALTKGYRLPVPRVRDAASSSASMLEPLELIENSQHSVVEVPSSYPDKGLPWVFAKKLAGSTLGGKIVIPITIAGREIRPPGGDLRHVLDGLGFAGILENTDFQPVIILTDFPFASSTRTAFIDEEIKKYPHVRYVIISYGPYESLISERFSLSAWQKYALCDVSFRSIVDFLSANFQMERSEAEVIALRLSNTFRAFNVSAHPSYFAGIPREMLSRFTEVNHRAEIIDLAVTGFLSFLGAGETKDVNLKQRTRRLFLQELAHILLLQRESMGEVGLVDFVTKYSEDRDLGLEPTEFIHSFVSNGILTVRHDRVEFTIPFIQNYLLAERLTSEPEVAKKYFDPLLGEVDFKTFELYSEIGLSDDVLNDVRKRIKAHIDHFESTIGVSDYTKFVSGIGGGTYKRSGHVLTSDRVRPAFLKDLRKLAGHRERLETMAVEVLNNSDDADSKQRLIDLTDRVAETTKARHQEREEASEANSAHAEIGRDWMMGVIMLGSAAEELKAETKRELAAELVRLASLILDDWLSSRAETDFEKIADEVYNEFRDEEMFAEKSDAEARQLITMTVEFVELRHLYSPYFALMGIIAEYARNSVLYQSVERINPGDNVMELIIASWIFELKPAAGKKAFAEVMKTLPKTPFLRVLLANYLISRAYWFQSKGATKASYVEGAREALKPLKITFDDETVGKEDA